MKQQGQRGERGAGGIGVLRAHVLVAFALAAFVLAAFALAAPAAAQEPPQETPGEGRADRDAPDEAARDESSPDESAPGESTSRESTPGESAPGESTPRESTPRESTPRESTPAAPTAGSVSDGGSDSVSSAAPAGAVTPPSGYTTDVTRTLDEDDPVWARYHAAALALADDDRDGAIRLLREIRARHPEHPAAAQAGQLLDRLGASERRPSRSGERRTGLARAELVVTQTAHGAASAALVCGIAECDGVRAWTMTTLLGAGVGLGVSAALSRDGVTPGQTVLYDSAARWGAYNGWLLASALGVTWRETSFGDVEGRYEAHLASLLLGELVGLGTALAVDLRLGPSAGDVGLMDSMQNLTSVTYLLVASAIGDLSALDQKWQRQLFFGGLLVANGAALTVGALLTRRVELTRGRAMLLDLGLATGVGLGLGVVALAQGEDASRGPLLGAAALGGLGGFAFSWWLTRRFDGRDDRAEVGEPGTVRFGFAPTQGGGLARIDVGLR